MNRVARESLQNETKVWQLRKERTGRGTNQVATFISSGNSWRLEPSFKDILAARVGVPANVVH